MTVLIVPIDSRPCEVLMLPWRAAQASLYHCCPLGVEGLLIFDQHGRKLVSGDLHAENLFSYRLLCRSPTMRNVFSSVPPKKEFESGKACTLRVKSSIVCYMNHQIFYQKNCIICPSGEYLQNQHNVHFYISEPRFSSVK